MVQREQEPGLKNTSSDVHFHSLPQCLVIRLFNKQDEAVAFTASFIANLHFASITFPPLNALGKNSH